MKIDQTPKFKIHKIHSIFDYNALNIKDFWVYCGEQGIESLGLEFFKTLNGSVKSLEFNKLFNKLQQIENKEKFIRSKLPKYIMHMFIHTIPRVTTKNDPEVKLLEFLDNIYGSDKVKTTPASHSTISIEVWLKDDDDLATLEFYTATNPELFYHNF